MLELFLLSLGVFLVVLVLPGVVPHGPRLRRVVWSGVGIGAFLQLAQGVIGLVSGRTVALFALPPVPVLGTWSFVIDPLSSLIFLILGAIGVSAALMALDHGRHRGAGTGLGMGAVVAVQFLFTGLFLSAQNALPLLITWEAMSLCAYAYILVLHHRRSVRQAAYVTLLVSEIGFLLLVLAAITAAPAGGSFNYADIAMHLHTAPPRLRDAVFLLALFGFGVKSGVLPMQLWMPDAYDSAPAHLNAILAGGLLNLGLYGILRVAALTFPLSNWVGLLVVWLGVAGLLLGALFAVIESRLRRLLAYSSIENVGLMLISLGVALLFEAHGQPQFANLAFIALFVQMVSHALAKALAFLAVGEIARRTGSTSLDELGGLWRSMPGVAVTLLIACLSLAAVAPFSGFTAEWLTLQSMLQLYRALPAAEQVQAALAGMIAAVGTALALTAFLKVFVFTMTGRRRETSRVLAAKEHKMSRFGGISLGFLAALSSFYGFVPTSVIPWFQNAVVSVQKDHGALRKLVPTLFHPPVSNSTIAQLGGGGLGFLPVRGFAIEPGAFVAAIAPTYLVVWFCVFAALGVGLTRLSSRRTYKIRRVNAWLGGRESRAAASQYTGSAYANPYRMFWSAVLGYKLERRLTGGSPSVPTAWELNRRVVTWLAVDHLFAPSRLAVRILSKVRKWQHGYLSGYLLTMLAGVLALLAAAMLYRG